MAAMVTGKGIRRRKHRQDSKKIGRAAFAKASIGHGTGDAAVAELKKGNVPQPDGRGESPTLSKAEKDRDDFAAKNKELAESLRKLKEENDRKGSDDNS